MKNAIKFGVANSLFAICLTLLTGCFAPPPRAGEAPPASVPQGSIGDTLLKSIDQLNQGLQVLAKASTQVALAPQAYEVAVKQAVAQADLNGNGKVDPSEKPLYYSILAGLLSTAGSTALSKLASAGQQKQIQAQTDDHADEIAALKLQLATLQAVPKA